MESPKLFSPEMATAAASLNVMGRLIAVSSPGWMNFARRAAPTSEMPRRLMARQASFDHPLRRTPDADAHVVIPEVDPFGEIER